jgi:hypothetical protein
VPEQVRKRVRVRAGDRWGYCRAHQIRVYAPLEIEHIVPVAVGGPHDESNLWLACRLCNLYKAAQTHGSDPLTGKRTRLFNPRRQSWARHFRWAGPRAAGLTPCGRATVAALRLNNPTALENRREWMSVVWHPPEE